MPREIYEEGMPEEASAWVEFPESSGTYIMWKKKKQLG